MTMQIEALITPVKTFFPKYISGLNPAPKNAQGFELELETDIPVMWATGKLWTSKKEGSLRNYGSELILNKPLAGEALLSSLKTVEAIIDENRPYLIDTIRTSTHVHHNIQDKTGLDILSIFGLYWIVEDLLMDFCGPWRKGNYNCLSLSETNSLLAAWSKHLRETSDDPTLKKNYTPRQSIYNFCTENFRYSSLNPNAIRCFGSVEFRGMRSLTKADDLITWSTIIQRLIFFQEYHGNLNNIIKRFQGYTPVDIIVDIFGVSLSKLLIKTACKNWEDELSENLMRVIHLRNSLFTWDPQALTEYYTELKKNWEEEFQKDPFNKGIGFDPRKLKIPVFQKRVAEPVDWDHDNIWIDHPPIPLHAEAALDPIEEPKPNNFDIYPQQMAIEDLVDVKAFILDNKIIDRMLPWVEMGEHTRNRAKLSFRAEIITERVLFNDYLKPNYSYQFVCGKFATKTRHGAIKWKVAPFEMKIFKNDNLVVTWTLRTQRR